MKIGIPRLTYAEKRCIVDNGPNTYKVLKCFDIYMVKKFIKNKIGLTDNSWIFEPIFTRGIDFIHTFNYVNVSKKNWITTYETTVPRLDDNLFKLYKENGDVEFIHNPMMDRYLSYISGDNCKKIIALSNCNQNIQKTLLQSYPKYQEKIRDKMIVISPPQKKLIPEYSSKKLPNNHIVFTFVGRDFYRKGGAEIVLAFDELVNSNQVLKNTFTLNLIGDLNCRGNKVLDSYPDTEFFYKSIEDKIRSNSYIQLFSNLSNFEVIEIISRSHIGLLPTWADTYGYSLLEFMAAGCPVISTNVRALTEINSLDRGYIINLPLNNIKEVFIKNEEDKENIRRFMIDNLKKIIITIIENSEDIESKGIKSLQYIENEHCPEKYFRKLEKIYEIS